MKSKRKIEKEVKIPEGVEVEIKPLLMRVKGPKGEISKKLYHPRLKREVKEGKIIIAPVSSKPYKKDKTLIGTFKSHIENLIKGVTEGYEYKLKICSGHFPMSVEVKDGEVVIKNFLGEKIPRRSKILEGVDVKIEGDIITVTGINKEAVGQTAASIEQSTRITKRDRRIFQDGCYIISKAGKGV